MEVIKFVILCLVLITTWAAENDTANLEQQLKIQKREKHYLIEDEPCEGPQQKRDERQSNPYKTTQNDSNVKSKPITVRSQPKILPTPHKPVLKPKSTNFRIDTTPQRIPTKIPASLKTTRVVPTPALRLQINESRKTPSNNEKELNTNNDNGCLRNKENPSTSYHENIIPFSIEDKTVHNSESRSGPSKEEETKTNKEIKGNIQQKDSKVTSIEDEQIISNKHIKTDIDNEDVETSVKVMQKPQFFLDETDPLPRGIKKQTKSKNKESGRIKEIPLTKKGNRKQGDTEIERISEPDVVQISNGTHTISIKRNRNNDRHKIQISDEPEVEERIINQRPPKPKPVISVGDKLNKTIIGENVESVDSSGIGNDCKKKEEKESDNNIKEKYPDAKENKGKDQNECITISNHDYEEFSEKTIVTPIVTIEPTNYEPANFQNDGSGSCSYLQNHQNSYANAYNKKIFDNYRKYHNGVQVNPNLLVQANNNDFKVSNDPYTLNSDISPVYSLNENQVINYNDPYGKIDQNAYCSEPHPDNTLDRIWRAWKDVEIKIKKSQNKDEPINIDIRRNMVDGSSNLKNFDVAGRNKLVGSNSTADYGYVNKLPIPYASQPTSLNGYYNNQNSGLIYPYLNPAYRYVR